MMIMMKIFKSTKMKPRTPTFRNAGQAPLEKSPRRKDIISLAGQAAVEIAVLGSLILLIFSMLLSYSQRFDSQLELKMEVFRKALNRSYARNAAVSYTLRKDKRPYNLLGNYGESQPTSMGASATVMWQKGMAGCQDGDLNCQNKRDEGTAQSSFAYYEINNQLIGARDSDVAREGGRQPDIMLPRYSKVTKDYWGNETKMKVPASIWNETSRRRTNLMSYAKKEERPQRASGPSDIYNSQIMNLNEDIYSQVALRFDTRVSDAKETVHTPTYDYSIAQLPVAQQGAYYNIGKNRIEYDPMVQPGSTFTKWRNWRTNFE